MWGLGMTEVIVMLIAVVGIYLLKRQVPVAEPPDVANPAEPPASSPAPSFPGDMSPGLTPPATQPPSTPGGAPQPPAGAAPPILGVVKNIAKSVRPSLTEDSLNTIATKLLAFSTRKNINLDPLLVCAVVTQESEWNPKAFNSGHEERGLMQVTPIAFEQALNTFKDIPRYPIEYLLQIGYGLWVGCAYLRYCIDCAQSSHYSYMLPFFNNDILSTALYMYNAGFQLGVEKGLEYKRSVMNLYADYKRLKW